MRGLLRWGVPALIAVIVLASLVAAPVTTASPRDGRTATLDVSIVRTSEGIPHVRSDTWRGLGFGEGLAFAQDDFCVLANDVVTLDAQRSRFFGPDGRLVDEAAGLNTDNLTSDFGQERLLQDHVVESALAGRTGPAPSAQARQLVVGYAEGVDRYLQDVGGANGIRDPACRGAAWVRPVTAMDIWRRLYQLSLLSASGSLLPELVSAQPPDAAGSASPVESRPPGVSSTPRWVLPSSAPAASSLAPIAAAADRDLGSNAWGFGSAGASGAASVLFGNPHYPWTGPERLWEVQLILPGQLDVEGATLAGVPGVLIGFTSTTGWSLTVSAAATAAVYALQLVPGDPTSYLWEGRPEKMRAQHISVTTSDAFGLMGLRSRTLWSSRLGPILEASGLPWTGTRAYALRDANVGNLRLLDTVVALDKSHSVTDVRAALAQYQGFPWVNTIAVDATGKAMFTGDSVVIHLTNAQLAQCAVPGSPWVLGVPTLDGSKASCLPGADADAAVPGILGPAALPVLIRDDYVQNSNDGPLLTNLNAPLTGLAAVTGDLAVRPSTRTRLGLIMIGERLAGLDGLPGKGFSLSTVESVFDADRDLSAELILPALRQACGTAQSAVAPDGKTVDLRVACATLQGWNGRHQLTDRGAVLFTEFMGALERLEIARQASIFQVPFDPFHPVTTPRGVDPANPMLLSALAEATELLDQRGIPVSISVADAQYVIRGRLHIPLPGGDDDGVFNVVNADYDPHTGAYTDVHDGVSFVLAVSFTAAGPTADAVLAYSESEDPTSIHSTDQTLLYSHSAWNRLAFTAEQIQADRQSVLSTSVPPEGAGLP